MASANLNDKMVYLSQAFKRVPRGMYIPDDGGAGGGTPAAWITAAIAAGATHVYRFVNATDEEVDQSGNGYNLTPPAGDYSGSVTGGGPWSTYIDMSGFADGWDRTEGADDLNPNIFSVEVIVYIPALAAADVICANDSGSGSTRPWVMQIAANGDLQAFANNQAGPVITSTGTALDDNDFHHIVFTHNWTTGNTNHFVDNSQTQTNASGSTSKQTNTNMSFGSQRPAVNMWSGGVVGFAYYSGTELASSTVNTLYNSVGFGL